MTEHRVPDRPPPQLAFAGAIVMGLGGLGVGLALGFILGFITGVWCGQ